MENPLPALIVGHNITLVYKKIDAENLDIRPIRKAIGSDHIVTQFPGVILIVSQDEQIVVQIGDRRVRINSQTQGKTITPIWKLAATIHPLITEDLIAFGFNYDFELNLPENAVKIILDLFQNDLQAIHKKLGGEILRFIPRISYQKENVIYDLIIDPESPQKLKVHQNAHYGRDTLPNESELGDLFKNEFFSVIDIITRLIEKRNRNDES